MPLRTQLFTGIAILAVALVAAQLLIQRRQLRAFDEEVNRVATTISRYFFRTTAGTADMEIHHTTGGGLEKIEAIVEERGEPAGAPTTEPAATPDQGAAPPPARGKRIQVVRKEIERQEEIKEIVALPGALPSLWIADPEAQAALPPSWQAADGPPAAGDVPAPHPFDLSDLDVRLASPGADDPDHNVLVVQGLPGGERRISLEGSQRRAIVEATLKGGLLTTAALLGLGLVAAAVFADRVSRPLRQLAAGAEALSAGALGTRVEVRASGEVGELVDAFNHMSARLAALEAERARWRAREQLAELGDLARGLAHTLRNPLNTLGLAVEELGEGAGPAGADLSATARGQIQRIDRWLKGFLALGAGDAARRSPADLTELAEAVALELSASGAVELRPPAEPVVAEVVAPAIAAALSNLVANAVEASPPDAPVELSIRREGAAAILTVADRGPGLPEAVRARLFSPHTTTKAHGSGMGLYLARQLVEGGHGGRLTLEDRPGGGTLATVTLPLTAQEGPR